MKAFIIEHFSTFFTTGFAIVTGVFGMTLRSIRSMLKSLNEVTEQTKYNVDTLSRHEERIRVIESANTDSSNKMARVETKVDMILDHLKNKL